MNPTDQIRRAIYALCLPALAQPQHLHVSAIDHEGLVILQIEAGKEDMPRMVGKQGANITALKALAAAAGHATRQVVRLNLQDPTTRTPLGFSRQPWTLEQVTYGVQAFIDIVSPGTKVGIVPSREAKAVMMISTKVNPAILAPLAKWLHVMAYPGKTCIIIEDPAIHAQPAG